jgi:hypothetical protein
MPTLPEDMVRCQHGWSTKRLQPGQIGSKPKIRVDLSAVVLGVTLRACPTVDKIVAAHDLSILVGPSRCAADFMKLASTTANGGQIPGQHALIQAKVFSD